MRKEGGSEGKYVMNAATQVLLEDGYRSTDVVFRGWA